MNACLAHFQYKLAATSVLTCMVCLARGILGKGVQTARGDVGTQEQLCLLGQGRDMCLVSPLCTSQELHNSEVWPLE